MIDFEPLLVESSRKLMEILAEQAGDDKHNFAGLITLSLAGKGVYSARATRVAALCNEVYPKLFGPHIKRVILALPTIKPEGALRETLRMLYSHLDEIKDEEAGRLIDFCFNKLQQEDSAIAIKYYSMDILEYYCRQLSGLQPEFMAVLESLLHSEQGTIKRKVGRIIKKMD
jgi:hypothetical protein